jgi:hypothetical protein
VKDWQLIVKAHGYDVSEQELGRIKQTLDALEETFRPLTKLIPLEVEPAVIFRCSHKESR